MEPAVKTDELPQSSEVQRCHIERVVDRLQNIKTDLIKIEKITAELVKKHIPYLTSLYG